METIYSRYRTGNPSFGTTLNLLQDLLTARLLPGFRRIWVQGSNSGKVTLLFTIFEEGHVPYRMEFVNFKNFRQYRPDGDIDNEIRLMTEIVDRLVTGPLAGVIS